jgi:hypothetical protein
MSEATASKSKTLCMQRKTTRTREKYFGAAETEPRRRQQDTEAENTSARKDGTGARLLTKTTEPDCWTRTRLRSKKYKRTGAGHGVGQVQKESSTHLVCSTAKEKQIGT